MKITFLGTGAGEGYPDPWCGCRNCSYARSHGGKNLRDSSALLVGGELMIDMTSAALRNAVRYGISLNHVRTLLITHPHTDHFTPDHLWLRGYPPEYDAFSEEELAEKKGAPCVTPLPMLDIYGTSFTGQAIAEARDIQPDYSRYHFAFHQTKGGESFAANGWNVTVLAAHHGPAEGFAVNYILEKDGKSLLYASDTGGYSDETWAEIYRHQLCCVILEGTFGRMPAAEDAHHMNLEKDERFFERLRANGCLAEGVKLLLTHMSPHWTPPHDVLAPLMAEKGIIVAYDGLQIEI